MNKKRSLDDVFLDQIIAKVQEQNLHYYENLEACFSREDVVYKLEPAIEYLVENNYIKYRIVGSQKYFDITPKGIKLEQSGGFAKLTNEKNQLFIYAKGSHDYAKKAYYMTIVAVIIAALSIIISLIF